VLDSFFLGRHPGQVFLSGWSGQVLKRATAFSIRECTTYCLSAPFP